LISGRPIHSLHPSGPHDDEPVAIPLSTAEKSVFAPEICLVTIKNVCEISSLSVIRATRATAEIGCAGTGLATDRQRNLAAHFGLAEFGIYNYHYRIITVYKWQARPPKAMTARVSTP
jgi:hypothetical protein